MITIQDFHTYKNAVITQEDSDQGDSLQRSSMYLVGKALLDQPDWPTFHLINLYLWDIRINRPLRAAVKWTDPKDVSRDQQDPTEIAYYLYGHNDRLKLMLKDKYRKMGRYENADIAGPVQWACNLRMLNSNWGYPFLFILDIAFLISAIIDVMNAWLHFMKDGSWLDMDNAVTRLCFAAHKWPTPWIFLTHLIYEKCFPQNLGGKGIEGCLLWKHRKAAQANPAMAKLWIEIWRKTFS